MLGDSDTRKRKIMATCPKNSSSAGVTGGGFTLIGLVGSSQSQFKDVPFSKNLLKGFVITAILFGGKLPQL